MAPAFTPDGRTVYFSSLRGSSQLQIYRKPADGSSEAEMVLQSERPSVVLDISRDGEHLLYLEVVPETQNDLRLLHLPSGEARDFVATSFNEGGAVFSPDGQWVAYQSDESGAFEIYVRPFPGPGGKWQVSSDRGRWPRWSADGRSLYYRSEESLMRVSVQAEGTGLRIGTPEEVSTLSRDLLNGGWDLASDGRFLLIRGPEESESEHGPNLARITFNWLDELERMLAGQ